MPLSLGLIGCGSFGRFCLDAYQASEAVQVVAVADTDRAAAETAAREFNLAAYHEVDALLEREDIDLIHVTTPPHTHFPLAMQALRAGKHVLCEKPLALTLAEADELIRTAQRQQRILPVDFLLRYNPIVRMVREVIRAKLLGAPLFAHFENCASDTGLGDQHWFWDGRKSGGIFVEHGVHFFDLYHDWFGEAEIVHAHAEMRPGTDKEDRVTSLQRHASGVLASHYHGFDQPAVLDRARHRVIFERGDLTIEGWIPTVLTVHALTDETGVHQLEQCLAGSRLLESHPLETTQHRGREIDFVADRRVTMQYQASEDKQTFYAHGLRHLVEDQVAYLEDPDHLRIVTESDGRTALALALAATRRARGKKPA